MSTIRTYQASLSGGEVSDPIAARTDLEKHKTSLYRCRNFVLLKTGGVQFRPGFEHVCEVADSAYVSELIPFKFNSTKEVCMLEFGNQVMRPIYDGALVMNGASPVSIPTGLTVTQAHEMGFFQWRDIMYYGHHDFPPSKLRRNSWTSWTFEALTFATKATKPTGLSAALNDALPTGTETATAQYKISAVAADTGEESLPTAAVSVTAADPDDWPVGIYVNLSWTAQENVDHFRIYKSDNGIYGSIGLAPGDATAWQDDNVTPDLSDTVPEQQNPFTGAGNYPRLIFRKDSRLGFANTVNAPNAIWLSRTGFYENFSTSMPTKADDAMQISIGGSDEINGIIGVRDLLVFTAGSEYVVNGGGTGKPIKATTDGVSANEQTYWGSGKLPPLISGNTGMYIQGIGSAVRDISYNYSVDGFEGTDRSVLAEHLLQGYEIVSWAYAQVPDSTFWLVRNDGKLLSFTYFREQEYWGWALHTTQGAFERVAVIPGSDRHEVYCVVRRTINGQIKRFVERMASRLEITEEDSRHLDCHQTFYCETGAQEFSGLDYLEGMEVGVYADGGFETATVSGGKVSLSRAYKHVCIGLRYDEESYIQTLQVDIGALKGMGSTAGRPLNVAKVSLKVAKAREFYAGVDEKNMKFTKPTITNWGKSPELQTEWKEIFIPSTWNHHGQVIIRPKGPVPLTILGVSLDVAIGK